MIAVFEGADWNRLATANAQQCAEHCRKSSQCNFFTFDEITTVCFFMQQKK